MHHRDFAFDFDGTLAENGLVPATMQLALEQLHAAGNALLLVTGRRFGNLDLGPLGDLFTGIVWENGAVLYHVAAGEVYLPFGHLGAHLVEALEAARVPIERGRAIMSTWKPHEQTVWQVLENWDGDPVMVHNKEAVMAALNCCIVSHFSDPEAAQAIRQRFNTANTSLADVPRGHVWLWRQNLVRLRPDTRRLPHIRRLYKYLNSLLPAHKRFRFRDGQGFLNLEANSLFAFMQISPTLPIQSLAYQQPCIVREEMCPVPDKAIWLEQGEVRNGEARRWLYRCLT
jgi:haloacid dehalogenase-like hydrolase